MAQVIWTCKRYLTLVAALPCVSPHCLGLGTTGSISPNPSSAVAGKQNIASLTMGHFLLLAKFMLWEVTEPNATSGFHKGLDDFTANNNVCSYTCYSKIRLINSFLQVSCFRSAADCCRGQEGIISSPFSFI